MGKKEEKKRLKKILESIRVGIRLNTPAHKVEIPKNVYNRKNKHKEKYDE